MKPRDFLFLGLVCLFVVCFIGFCLSLSTLLFELPLAFQGVVFDPLWKIWMMLGCLFVGTPCFLGLGRMIRENNE